MATGTKVTMMAQLARFSGAVLEQLTKPTFKCRLKGKDYDDEMEKLDDSERDSNIHNVSYFLKMASGDGALIGEHGKRSSNTVETTETFKKEDGKYVREIAHTEKCGNVTRIVSKYFEEQYKQCFELNTYRSLFPQYNSSFKICEGIENDVKRMDIWYDINTPGASNKVETSLYWHTK